MGDRELAQSALEEAARVARPSFRTFYQLGGMYWQVRNLDRAAYYFARAARTNPRSANAFHGLALIEETNFHFHAARRAYARALQLAPANKRIREDYERFEQKLADNKAAQ